AVAGSARGPRASRDADGRAARPPLDRGAPDAPTTARGGGRGRTTAVRAPRSATRDRATARTVPRDLREQADPDPRRAPLAASEPPVVPDAPRGPRAEAPQTAPAFGCPNAATCR